MKRIFWVGLILVLLIQPFLFASSINDISEIGVGARPLGMGKAQLGLVSDNSSIYLNPAGLSEIDRFNVLTMSTRLLREVDYLTFAFSYPVWEGTAGLGIISSSVGAIPITTINAFGTPEASGDQASYGSQVFHFSYGMDLNRVTNMDILKPLRIGTSVKYYMQNITGNSASLSQANGSGIDLDLGVKYIVTKWISLGFMAQNFLPSSFGGSFKWAGSGLEESIPAVLKAGVGLKLWGKDAPFQVQAQEMFIACDTDVYYGVRRPNLWHLGLEWWPVEILALRIGIDQAEEVSEGNWVRQNNLTTGVGLTYGGFSFDYAYHQFGSLTENASHFFSIGYVGDMRADLIRRRKKRRRKPPVIFTEILPEPAIKTFKDVEEDYWARRPIEYLATLGIFSGFPDGSFKPEAPITRAEIAALLVNAKEYPLIRTETEMFSDLPHGHWAESHIRAAIERGLIGGYPTGKFEPNRYVSRAEGVVILTKFADLHVEEIVPEKPFPDVKTSHWAAREIYAAKHNDLLRYLAGKKFEPEKKITRAEVAEIISKTKFGRDKIREFLLYRQKS